MSCTFSRKNQVQDVAWRERNQQQQHQHHQQQQGKKQKNQEQPIGPPPPALRVPQLPGPSHPSEKMSASPINGRNSTQTCCFCWCCCCSCSCFVRRPHKQQKRPKILYECISIQDREESQDRPSEDASSDPITYDEVVIWGKSFERLLKNKKGQEVFRQFLRSEFSEENVLFWIACENLKYQAPADYVEEQARSIYEDYISIFSPKEVSLDSEVRELIDKNMVNPTRNTFDEAQIQIFTLMQRDSYPRFVSSNLYKQLLNSTQPSGITNQPAASSDAMAVTPSSGVVVCCSNVPPQNASGVAKVFGNFGPTTTPTTTATATTGAAAATTTTTTTTATSGGNTNGTNPAVTSKPPSTVNSARASTASGQATLQSKIEKQPLLDQESTRSFQRNNGQSMLSPASSALEQLQHQNSVEINYLTLGTDAPVERKDFNIPGGDANTLAMTAINT